jgi:hydrogenase/urease accessory protein HupE
MNNPVSTDNPPDGPWFSHREVRRRSMHQHSGFCTCGKIQISFLLLVLCVLNAKAHDPGLSTATVTVGDHRIEVLLSFANKDAESLLRAAGNDRNLGSTERVDRHQLERLAIEETDLYLGERKAVTTQAMATRKDGQTIDVLLRFDQVPSDRMRLVAKFLARLPYGHREFLTIRTTNGVKLSETILSAKESSVDLPTITAVHADRSFVAFVMLGVEHILTGYDHLLFLFGLLVVCRDLRSILTVITCFTIAHSITLALSTLDLVRLPARIVEPLIAASIAYVGLENLLRGDSPRWRWLITFSFGLVHGLGFADALKELGIGRLGVVWPLIGFNCGVEIGQLSVAGVVLPVLWQLRRNPFFIRQWVPLCSVAVALAGSYWMVERVLACF